VYAARRKSPGEVTGFTVVVTKSIGSGGTATSGGAYFAR